MALDPSASISRKVWQPCSHCRSTDGLYLLDSDASLVYVQCGACHTCWWLDTGNGAGRRPTEANELPTWPG